ncbi:MAG TPA: transcription antitermination factor NusB [Deltaproteobacteria bacterium]|nr:transcription antitermination factor NusB [Deltaproteobacteria bacterium]
MRTRTKAREIALQYLYQVDITSDHTEKTLDDFIDHFVDDEEIVPYAKELVGGVYAYLSHIDDMIEKASRNWTVSRMSSIDRNILRIATYELAYKPDIPYKVAINEGIELAKRFGSPRFPAFANGVLDRVRTEVASHGSIC